MPCALILDVARTLNPYLDERMKLADSGHDLEEEEAAETTLQLIFFDGEEAFRTWTNTDSIYGARLLQLFMISNSANNYPQTFGGEMGR
jgi:glutaminyl-peptide cyclotransferase